MVFLHKTLGDRMTVFVGDNMTEVLYITACVYGGPTNTLDDCGNVNSALGSGSGTVLVSFDIGAGFTAALVIQVLVVLMLDFSLLIA